VLVCVRMDDVLGLEFVVGGEEAVEPIELDTTLLKLDCAEGMIKLVLDGFARDDCPGILVEPEADIKDGISGGWG
jgi:hypothetical protein